MHIFKLANVSAILGLVLVNTALAAEPVKCPGVSDIQAQQDDKIITCTDGDCIFSMENHRFDTDVMWHFSMHIPAASNDEAESKAADAMKSLAYASGPAKDSDGNTVCKYNNSYGFDSHADYIPAQ
jgi:hypothetical protein